MTYLFVAILLALVIGSLGTIVRNYIEDNKKNKRALED